MKEHKEVEVTTPLTTYELLVMNTLGLEGWKLVSFYFWGPKSTAYLTRDTNEIPSS